MMAEIGTPCGSSNLGLIDGHCAAGAVKRLFGCAAFSLDAGVHGWPFQSVALAGGAERPSHHGCLSAVTAVFVKMLFLRSEARAFGLVFSLVPGATPKKPDSGLMAKSRPSGP